MKTKPKWTSQKTKNNTTIFKYNGKIMMETTIRRKRLIGRMLIDLNKSINPEVLK